MFINHNNTLINSDNISYLLVKNKSLLFAIGNRNFLVEYGNEDLAKNALSKIRVGLVKGSSIVDISEDKVQNDLI